MVRAMAQAHVVEQLGRAPSPLRTARPRLHLRQLHVLPGREHGQEEEALEHEADPAQAEPAPLRVAQGGGVASVDEQGPGGGRIHAADQVQQGVLPAVRRPGCRSHSQC